MNIIKILLGLLLLRRRSLRGLVFWAFRLSFWSVVLSAAVRVVRNRLGPKGPVSFSAQQSGWTMPGVDATLSSRTVSSFADEPLNAGATVQQRDDIQPKSFTTTENALDEMKIAPPNEDATDDLLLEADADFQPRWIKGDGSSDCPIDFPVKAKASSLIYHSPESQHFLVTIPDVCFASVEDAEAAGYRAPKR
ncbi:hypothetical protein BH23CHL5_BH23CHL5_19430 [soil metagenome]